MSFSKNETTLTPQIQIKKFEIIKILLRNQLHILDLPFKLMWYTFLNKL